MKTDRRVYYVKPEVALQQSLVEHAKDKPLYHENAKWFELWKTPQMTAEEGNFILDIIGSKRMRVIDMGCGVGRHSRYLSQWHDMTGIDLSADELALAKKNAPNVNFVQLDMRNVGQLEGTFDAAICMWTTFNYLSLDSDVRAFFDGLHKKLRDDGLVVIDSSNDFTPFRERHFVDGITDVTVRVYRETLSSNIIHHLYIYNYFDPEGKHHVRLDQELNRVFTTEDIVSLAGPEWELFKAYGDYDVNSAPSATSRRSIAVLRKNANR